MTVSESLQFRAARREGRVVGFAPRGLPLFSAGLVGVGGLLGRLRRLRRLLHGVMLFRMMLGFAVMARSSFMLLCLGLNRLTLSLGFLGNGFRRFRGAGRGRRDYRAGDQTKRSHGRNQIFHFGPPQRAV